MYTIEVNAPPGAAGEADTTGAAGPVAGAPGLGGAQGVAGAAEAAGAACAAPGGVTPPRNEVKEYTDARYISANEAARRLLQQPMSGRYPQVMRLSCNLPGEGYLVYDPDHAEQALETTHMSQLRQFFATCSSERASPLSAAVLDGNPLATQLLYKEMHTYYIWNARDAPKAWRRRNRPKMMDIVSRI